VYIVNMDVPNLLFLVEPIEIDTLLIIDGNVVADRDVRVGPFHDPTKPQVSMAIVILDVGIRTIIVRVKAPAVLTAFADVTIGFIILNFDSIRIKVEDAVPSAGTTAVSEPIVFINSIFTDSGDHIVTPRPINKIMGHVDVSP